MCIWASQGAEVDGRACTAHARTFSWRRCVEVFVESLDLARAA